MLKLGQGLAGDSPRAWRKATSHIGYKSPGHRYTENCLARVTATLSEDSLSLEDTARLDAYIHTQTHTSGNALVRKREHGENSDESWLEGFLAEDSQPVWQLNRTWGPFGDC